MCLAWVLTQSDVLFSRPCLGTCNFLWWFWTRCPFDFPFSSELRTLSLPSRPTLCTATSTSMLLWAISLRVWEIKKGFNPYSLVHILHVLGFWQSSPQFLFIWRTLHESGYMLLCCTGNKSHVPRWKAGCEAGEQGAGDFFFCQLKPCFVSQLSHLKYYVAH